MMKKILSLCLAVIMLLGIMAMGVSADDSAEPRPIKLSVLLSDGIAMKFTFTGLEASEVYDVKFTCGDDTTTEPYEADANGNVVATYELPNPAWYNEPVTAAIETENLTRTNSLLEYCDWALNNYAFSDDVYSVVVDLMNYCAATELYLDSEAEDPTTPNLVPSGELTEAQKDDIADRINLSWGSPYKLETSNSVINKMCGLLDITFNWDGHPTIANFFSVFGDANTGIKSRDQVPAERLQTYDMIVPNSWGGSYLTDAAKNTLLASDFEIGDILVIDPVSSSYVLAYLGNDTFNLWTAAGSTARGTITMDAVLNELLGGTSVTYTKYDGTSNTRNHKGCEFYCIVRPARLLSYSFAVESSTDLTELQAALGTANVPAGLPILPEADQEGFDVQFGNVTVLLGTSIGYRADILSYPEGTTFWGKVGNRDAVSLTPVTVGDRTYVDFTELNPSLATEVVTIYAASDELGENKISADIQCSLASYSSETFAQDGQAKIKNLVAAAMIYSQGVKNYVVADKDNSEHLFVNQPQRYASVGTFTAAEAYRLSKYDTAIVPTSSDRGYFWYKLASKIYEFAGVDFSDYAKFETLAASRNQIITSAGGAFVTQGFIYDMLVPGSYGGTSPYISGISGGGRLTLEQYQVGDIVFFGTSGSNAYAYGAVYLGENRFIMMYGHANKTGTTYNSAFVNLDELYDTIDGIAKTRYWMVLRPSHANYRSISDGALTAEEKAKLATLDPALIGGTYYNAGRFLPYIYGTMGVALTDANGVSIVQNCAAYATMLTSNGINTDSRYYPMLVNESWGGAAIEESCGNYVMAVEDYVEGDIVIFSDQDSGTYDYWTWVYIGNSNFMVEQNGATEIMTYNDLVEIMNYANGLELTVEDAKNPDLFTYLVLRPSQLANQAN